MNTDDHNTLEYGSPIAYFVAEAVRVPDSRRIAAERPELELTKFLAGRALTADEAADLYASLSWVHPPDDPLVRTAAAAWRDAEPSSRLATIAYGRVLLREGDVVKAFEVLSPLLASGEDEPDLCAAWLEISRRLASREGAPWHASPGDVADAEMRAKRALEKNPAHEGLQSVLDGSGT